MKAFTSSLLLLSTVALSGCGVSLQPFYTAATVLDNVSFEGRWTDGESTWAVSRTGPGHFEIATCDNDHLQQPCKADTEAVLFRAGGVMFLDFQEKGDAKFGTTIRPHGLFEVRTRADGLDLITLEPERLSKLAKQSRLDTEFSVVENDVILTGTTQNLQKFILRHLTDSLIFGEPHHLRRPAQA